MSKVPITYVDEDRTVRTDYVKRTVKPTLKPTEDYHPTKIIGICKGCHTVGNLMYPTGFDWRSGDNVMERRVIGIFCVRCRKETEFVPLKIGDQETQEGTRWLKKIEQKMQSEMSCK